MRDREIKASTSWEVNPTIINKFTTTNALVLYEICLLYIDQGRSELKDWKEWYSLLRGVNPANVRGQYEDKRRIFDSAVKEINSVSDLQVELLEGEAGPRARQIQFQVNRTCT